MKIENNIGCGSSLESSGTDATSAGTVAASLVVELGVLGATLIDVVAGRVELVGAEIASNAVGEWKKQNEELREELRKVNIDNATKQKVIECLNSQIEELKQVIAVERAKNQRNSEKIQKMQEYLDDLLLTIHTAQIA